jgi:hypothetical protein
MPSDIEFNQVAVENNQEIAENLEPAASKVLRNVVADAFAFIRSAEVNQAFATVTYEELISYQILRNGESSKTSAAQYDPYSFDPNKPPPAGAQPPAPSKTADFLAGTELGRPTKMDRLMAIVNSISDVVTQISAAQPIEVANYAEYVEPLDSTVPDTGIATTTG